MVQKKDMEDKTCHPLPAVDNDASGILTFSLSLIFGDLFDVI